MSSAGHALFHTALGACGIAWGPEGLLGLVLPDEDSERTRAQLRRRHPGTDEMPPPPEVRAIIERVAALLAGEAADLSAAELDFSATPEFNRRVYDIARAIPPGETRTYGEIARALGDVALSRAVGQALGQNPWPIVVPCHRVLAASGKTGGFSAPGGVRTKLRILSIEQRHAPATGLFADLPLAARPRS